MNPNKRALADKLFRNVQKAHIQGLITLHHAPTLEQTLENYHAAFKSHAASPNAARVHERVRRMMGAEFSAITDILAQCHDADKEKMLASLEAQPDLLNRLPLMTDYLVREDSREAEN